MSNQSPSTTASNKKAKKSTTTSTKQEINILKQYILQCPDITDVDSSHAVQLCMDVLEKEWKRIDRDEKLRLKFAKERNELLVGKGEETFNADNDVDDDVVCVEMNSSSSMEGLLKSENNTDLTEWQDITVNTPTASPAARQTTNDKNNTNNNIDEMTGIDKDEPSLLGLSLAQSAITDISKSNIYVSTPIAALALALHASLRSDILGFKCIGIPEEDEVCFSTDSRNNSNKQKKRNGFAAPVRELPKGKFLPDDWDKYALSSSTNNNNVNDVDRKVTLRYRKNGTGATILRVTQSQEETNTIVATISFGPAGGEPRELKVPVSRHINIDGLNAAIEKSKKVQPALHYLSLSLLLSDFCQNADLGIVREDSNIDVKMTTVDKHPSHSLSSTHGKDNLSNDIRMNNDATNEVYPMPLNTQDEFSQPKIPGDFSGDLLPSGIPAPGFANPRLGGSGGNLMGINDPYFQGNFDDFSGVDGNSAFPPLGGLNMQPRFDPYYPPGVNPGRGRFNGRGRGGRGMRGGGGRGGRDFSGDPNPDHERPPNTFGHNMFM